MILLSDYKEEISTIDHLNEQVLNEVYFGDSVMAPILQQFSKFRSKWIGEDYNPKINYDPDLIKFNRMIEQQFGYYRYCLSIVQSYSLNASMFNIDVLVDDDNYSRFAENVKVYKNSSGFKYTEDAHVSALGIIYFGVIVSKSLTDREIMGILLHEIGHSFWYSIIDNNNIASGRKANMLFGIFLNIMKLSKAKKDITPKEAENNIDKMDIRSRFKKFISTKKNMYINAFHSIKGNMNKYMQYNMNYADYTNEKFADTFASMYGYGADTQSGLKKMTDELTQFYAGEEKKLGPIRCAIKAQFLMWKHIMQFNNGTLDVHPENLARIKTQIEYLERELRNTAMDPMMKKDLQRQLDIQKDLIRSFIDYESDKNEHNAFRLYLSKLYEKYGGDIREVYTNNIALFEYIDKRVDELIKREAAVEDDDELEDEDVEPLNELIDGEGTNRPRINESSFFLTDLF